jgi:hypothetical protein
MELLKLLMETSSVKILHSSLATRGGCTVNLAPAQNTHLTHVV